MKRLTVGLVIASGTAAVTGCAERRVVYVPTYQAPPPYVYPAQPAPGQVAVPNQPVVTDAGTNPPPAAVAMVAPAAPPAPQVEVMPVAPGPEFYWVPGYWGWSGGVWVWVGGRWAPRPWHGAVWVGGHWARRGHGYFWVGGHWR